MPKNVGRMPSSEFVDIKLRNGQIRRKTEPRKWRWKAWPFESEWDIVQYQVVIENGGSTKHEDER